MNNKEEYPMNNYKANWIKQLVAILKKKNTNYGNLNHNYFSTFQIALRDHDLTSCIEILEDIGVPASWGIQLLPLMQSELAGGED